MLADARAEVVEHDDLVAAREQRLGQVAADETGAAGHEDAAQPVAAWARVRDEGRAIRSSVVAIASPATPGEK